MTVSIFLFQIDMSVKDHQAFPFKLPLDFMLKYLKEQHLIKAIKQAARFLENQGTICYLALIEYFLTFNLAKELLWVLFPLSWAGIYFYTKRPPDFHCYS